MEDGHAENQNKKSFIILKIWILPFHIIES